MFANVFQRRLGLGLSGLGFASALMMASGAGAQPITGAFNFQGELASGGTPAAGLHDMRFRLFDAASGGAQVGSVLCADNVQVAAGRFVTTLDFGVNAFAGQRRFLEIDVRSDSGLNCANNAGFTTLGPRIEVGATPYATFAPTAGAAQTAASATNATNAASLNGQPASFYNSASNLSAGVLADARLSANVPRLNAATSAFTGGVSATTLTGTHVGDGTGVTNLNASNVASGTLADARLSANVPRFDALGTFTQGIQAQGAGFVAPNNGAPTVRAELGWVNDKATLRVTGSGAGARNGLTFGTISVAEAMVLSDSGELGIGVTAPTQKLDVNGAVRSRTGGFVFPDGSTQQSALQAQNQTGISGGTQNPQRLRVVVNGVSTGVLLAEPIIFNPNADTTVRILRPLSGDATWRNAYRNATNLPLVLEVLNSTTNVVVATYTFASVRPVSWITQTADAGGVYESISLVYPSNGLNGNIPTKVVSTPGDQRPPIALFRNHLPATTGVDTRLRIGTVVRTDMTVLDNPRLTNSPEPIPDIIEFQVGYSPTSTASLWPGFVANPRTPFQARFVFETTPFNYTTIFTSNAAGAVTDFMLLKVGDDGCPIEIAAIKFAL